MQTSQDSLTTVIVCDFRLPWDGCQATVAAVCKLLMAAADADAVAEQTDDEDERLDQ